MSKRLLVALGGNTINQADEERPPEEGTRVASGPDAIMKGDTNYVPVKLTLMPDTIIELLRHA